MRVPQDRRIADLFEDLHINLYKTRRAHLQRQASRVAGAGEINTGGFRRETGARDSEARQIPGTRAVPGAVRTVSVRASNPMPGLYLIGISVLAFGGLLALVGVVAIVRWLGGHG